jgi:tRNA A-37 threonylcarbamoyl transferase component Bud32
MTPEMHQRVRYLFDEALQRPEAERVPFLQTACADNSEVFGQVTQLLAAHAEAGRFLEGERALPQRIGRYIVTGELGRGAMGIVFEALDPFIERKVAVKVIRLQALADGNEAAFLRERLFREARTAGGLFHPGIVVVLDVGQEGELAFIAMEYVDGPSLFQVLAERPRFDRPEALKILQQTAAALDFAHGKGVVHRDIKPANIMLEKGMTVKVADFGIAKVASSQRYTKTGMRMGTPRYMSPEQVDGKPLDGRSDQFSLAVVAYELLTGAPPFEAESFTALAHAIAYGPRPSARAANPELPSSVDQVFYRGLGKLPEERYVNCREFVAALEQSLTAQVSDSGAAPPIAVPPSLATPAVRTRGGKAHHYIVGGVLAAMLLTGLWLGFKRLTGIRATPPGVPEIVRFSADPQSIEAGDLATLSWEVHGADEVTIEPHVGAEPAAGRERVEPTATTSYRLTAANHAGKVFLDAYVKVAGSPLSLCLAGEAKLDRGQVDQGLTLLRRSAGLGEVRAMLDLGGFHSLSQKGFKRDSVEAAYWYDQAAAAGDRDGMLNLGACYYMGIGVRLDKAAAALWFGKAADMGSSDAVLNLGDMHERGDGFPRDLVKARELYRRAAQMGNHEAEKRLAELDKR